MTIIEAIKSVLSSCTDGLTAPEIYDAIISNGLYSFGAKKPIAVVNGEIRRRCKDLDFPTAYPTKVFEIVGYQGKKPKFSLINHSPSSVPSSTVTLSVTSTDQLPEERINSAVAEHYHAIKQQALDCILMNSPSFFEHLVIDLLLKMGYGCDKTSGVVTGRSHDGGIDGIISEDKLGLDLIYVQAKRYKSEERIGRKELQAFVGAMEHVQKGVFITTSSFTKEARQFIEKQQQKSIKLIDGELLSDLLIKYEVGITVVHSFSIYKIDANYYEDN